MSGQIAFREIVTSADGSTEEGTCSEAQASRLLATAVRRGYTVEATRQGGAVIVRTIPGAADHWTPPRRHTVTLEPVTQTGKVTDTMRSDLVIIGLWPTGRRLGARLNAGTGRIDAGLNSIPRGAAKRLIERGLVTVTDGAVTVSLSARLAMLAQEHRTETREPRGYVRPSVLGFIGNGVERKGNKMYDRSSVASCSCKGWSYPAEDRDDARLAHGHPISAQRLSDAADQAPSARTGRQTTTIHPPNPLRRCQRRTRRLSPCVCSTLSHLQAFAASVV